MCQIWRKTLQQSSFDYIQIYDEKEEVECSEEHINKRVKYCISSLALL